MTWLLAVYWSQRLGLFSCWSDTCQTRVNFLPSSKTISLPFPIFSDCAAVFIRIIGPYGVAGIVCVLSAHIWHMPGVFNPLAVEDYQRGNRTHVKFSLELSSKSFAYRMQKCEGIQLVVLLLKFPGVTFYSAGTTNNRKKQFWLEFIHCWSCTAAWSEAWYLCVIFFFLLLLLHWAWSFARISVITYSLHNLYLFSTNSWASSEILDSKIFSSIHPHVSKSKIKIVLTPQNVLDLFCSTSALNSCHTANTLRLMDCIYSLLDLLVRELLGIKCTMFYSHTGV